MKREFVCQDDRSNKFWTIEVAGNVVVTTNGRIGARPRETRKEFADPETANREAEKLIAAKLRGGYVEGAVADAPEYEKPDWASMEMSDPVFWRIIGLFDWKKTGDDDEVLKPAVMALSQMTVEQIERFEDVLAEKLFSLDTEAHARNIGEDSYSGDDKFFSVDLFLYARCVVVANGESYYANVLSHPADMPKDMEFECLLNLAGSAYQKKTGKELEHSAPVSYETFSNAPGWGRTT
jgi:predicted DNA-binding WGR domain protein